MPTSRYFGLAALLIASWLGLHVLLLQPLTPLRQPLSGFPEQVDAWRGIEIPIAAPVLQALNLHEYLNRVYLDPRQRAIGLYIAYYPTQGFGDDLHSPKNCLPGTGWEPLRTGLLTIALPGRRIRVNEYLVARGAQRELILYWYQQQGRVIASEYWSKFYQVWDGITQRRSDAALVRVAIPIGDGPAAAEAQGIDFVRTIFPRLGGFIPSGDRL